MLSAERQNTTWRREKMWLVSVVAALLFVASVAAVCPKTHCTTLSTCWDHGKCVIDANENESCLCDEGWTGTSCETRTCTPSTCVNGNCCAAGCCCDGGWSGAACDVFVGVTTISGAFCRPDGTCICSSSGTNCNTIYGQTSQYLTDLALVPFNKNSMTLEYYNVSACDCRISDEQLFLGSGVRKLLRVPAQVHNVGPSHLFVGTPHLPAFHYTCTNVPTVPSWIKFTLFQYTESAPATLTTILDFLEANPDGTPPAIGATTITLGTQVLTATRARMVRDDVRISGDYTAPKFINSMQGLSRGWAQNIPLGLCSGMWLDVTGVTVGPYVLRVEANPTQAIAEQNYANNVFDVLLACNPSCAHGTCNFGLGCICDAGWTGAQCDIQISSTPVCVPNCTNRWCGPDGCGGVCGVCARGHTCDDNYMCGCTPTCEAKECGRDSCGGFCGICLKANTTCKPCDPRTSDCSTTIYECGAI